MREVVRKMGADGWLGIGWPTEYGGQGRGPIDQFIFFDESMRAGAPVPMLTINSVAPTLMEFGSDEQKQRFLPEILKGNIHFCIGYSEPGAGTDLASLRTKAVRDGDSYVITGQKMWTSLASDADYCWLAARTGDEDSRHRGISLFIAPMDSPGIERTPLHLLSSHDICSVYWDDVRIPAENLVAGENEGWKLIVNQLNHERVTLCSPGMAEAMLHQTIDWARETTLPDGRRVIDQEWVQINLAKAYAGFEFLRLANWKVAWDATRGQLDVADASTIKVFGTEHYLESFRLLMEVLGERSYLTEDAPGVAARLAARADVPQPADPHVRGRHQRAATGPDRGLRHGHADGEALRRRGHTKRMDFDLSDEQQATIDVAAKLLGDKSTPDAIRAVEQADDLRFDRDLWAAMADAGLLGIAVPAEHGGAGLGVLELAMVLEEVGRRTAPVPALATLALGALPVARFGTAEQQAALLPGVVAGTTVLTAALVEPLGDPARPPR